MLVALVALAAAALVVVNHAANVGGAGGFVLAGEVHTNENTSIIRYTGDGYDGQFMYRMAVSPLSTAERVDGVKLDLAPYRQQRIGYPLLAWTIAQTPLTTAQAMIVVNLIAVAAAAYFASRLATHYEREPWWGLAVVAWPGFYVDLTRDLAGIVAATAVLSAMLFIVRGHHLAAAGLFAAAVLTREVMIVFAVAALVIVRKKIYLMPLGLAGLWQGIVWWRWGDGWPPPALNPEAAGMPLQGLVDSVVGWQALDWLAAIIILVVAVLAIRRASWTVWGIAGVVYAVMMLMVSEAVWVEWQAFTRAATGLWLAVFGSFVLRESNESRQVQLVVSRPSHRTTRRDCVSSFGIDLVD